MLRFSFCFRVTGEVPVYWYIYLLGNLVIIAYLLVNLVIIAYLLGNLVIIAYLLGNLVIIAYLLVNLVIIAYLLVNLVWCNAYIGEPASLSGISIGEPAQLAGCLHSFLDQQCLLEYT